MKNFSKEWAPKGCQDGHLVKPVLGFFITCNKLMTSLLHELFGVNQNQAYN